ncbi:hypothetical protein J1G42_14375 [Cellulomonas sp. zg-ZUI222]|uniref:hypothetical protein n=1 Tax=Cellulomonas TaxID=1707 RepID=UPI001A93C4E4|nr:MULTISPECIES: hypothetical protein [Cellulomonas]MBO0901770.1 hypothetical protein [Cellulomonas sp. zg-ZUI22]MBO0922007.1 hypothetical protein [Cellulomonas wangleii]
MGFIQIEDASGVVASMRRVADDLDEAQHELRTRAAGLEVDSASLSRLPPVTARIRALAADLQTRVDLATAIEAGRSAWDVGSTAVEVPDVEGEDLYAAMGRELAFAARGLDPQDTGALAWFDGVVMRHRNSTGFAASFLSTLGGGETLDLMTRIASSTPPGGAPGETQRRTMSSLRYLLHVADRGWDDAQRSRFAAEAVGAATGPHEGDPVSPFVAGYGGALSYLLDSQQHSSALTLTIARGLDEYEGDAAAAVGRPADDMLWTRRLTGLNPWAGFFPQLPGGGTSPASWDPGIGLMSALARDPAATVTFFTEGSDHREATARMTYWLHDRPWDDQFSAVSRAMVAATTDPDLLAHPATARAVASLTAAVVNLIGTRTDIDRDVLTGGYGPTDAANNFAMILATHALAMDSATRSIQMDVGTAEVIDAGTAWFHTGELGVLPVFDARTSGGDARTQSPLGAFVTLASATTESTATLRAGVDRYAAVKYGIALGALEDSLEAQGTVLVRDQAGDQLDGHPTGLFTAAWKSQAGLEGMLTHAVGRRDIDDAQVDAARTEAWTTSLITVVSVSGAAGAITGDIANGVRAVAATYAQNGQPLDGAQRTVVSALVPDLTVMERVEGATKEAAAARERAYYQAISALATSRAAPADLAAPLRHADGGALTYEEFRMTGMAADELTYPRNLGELLDPGEFGEKFIREFLVLYPTD